MSVLSNITSRIFVLEEFRKRQIVYEYYRNQFRNRLNHHNWDPELKVEGEDEYIRIWKQICPRIEPYSYRFFSHYMGSNPYIIPEDIGRTYIEYYLNPLGFRSYYSDKNMYQQYIRPNSLFPKVYYRRILSGEILDAEFNVTEKLSYKCAATDFARAMTEDEAVLKPTNNSGGGLDVQRIKRKEDGLFYSDNGSVVDGQFLAQFAQDWNIQEIIEQHPFFAYFSETSLNTMRIYLYRSVKDDQIMIYNACLRIGRRGSFVDNAAQGGAFIKIDIDTGKMVGDVVDEEGYVHNTMNDVDFTKEFVVPQWEKVKKVAIDITKQLHHCHMVALDLCIDKNDQIRMIEHNIGDTSYWMSFLINMQPFGDRIQEVIDYCVEQKKKDFRFKYIDR